MHPLISYFPNKKLFNGQPLNAPSVLSRIFSGHTLSENIFGAYSFLNVSDGREISDGSGQNWKNLVEAAVICTTVMKLHQACVKPGGRVSIGVMAPYNAQVQAIQEMLSGRIKSNRDVSLWVRLFGQTGNCEVDFLIISTVRCNESGDIGSLSDMCHVNFCLTRARHCLWIVGNEQTLAKGCSIWKELVIDAKERGRLFQVEEDKHIAQVVLDVKWELCLIDALSNHDSTVFCYTKWKILFSEQFKKSFLALKTVLSKQIVMGFLLKLASGWRPKRKSPSSSSPRLPKFMKIYRVHGLFLVCTTDIVKDSNFVQVLRVWDLLPLVDIPKLEAKLKKMVALCDDDYIKSCLEEKHEGNLVVPMTWELSPYSSKYKRPHGSSSSFDDTKGSVCLENSEVGERLLLMKFYSLSYGNVKNILTASNGKEIELPFEVSDAESEIIKFGKSAFVLGRSGTGKTIVTVMKLLKREQDYTICFDGLSDSVDHACPGNNNVNQPVPNGFSLRQIYVTVSPNLCSAMKHYITQLRRVDFDGEIQGEPPEVEMNEIGDSLSMFSDIPDSFNGIPQKHFPLVISLRKFLVMLDGSVKSSFFDRFHDLKFISHGKRAYLSHASQQIIRSKEVDFDRFCTSYWPKFNTKLTCKLDPLLVFTQIISYIKGGCGQGRTIHDKKMAEKDYVMLSETRNSTLSKDRREMIYKLFMDYEKKKSSNGDYDISDLVMDLHQRLREQSESECAYLKAMTHFIYIDEVQDFTLNQLSLFRYLSTNVQDGFLFSGDTAQTIVKGVDSSFKEIRAMFYREFVRESLPYFNLTENFRTHSGVLNLAQSVLDLLYEFFPESVDHITSEKSIISGQAPVLIEYINDGVLKTMFGAGGVGASGLINFGPQQVILVRDNHAKEEVIGQIGKCAIVLTILESKGLEFEDVLLYNFFESSPLKRQWRVIYDFMDKKGLLYDSSLVFPSFVYERHSTLCSELKQLYVAVTRTRERLWIFERMVEFAKPLFDYWKRKGVVQLQGLDSAFIDRMKTLSTPEAWNIRGQKLFNEGNYEAASICFEHFGDRYRQNWAKAASLQLDGDRNLQMNYKKAMVSLLKAADIYEEIGKYELCATCFMKLKNFEKAGRVYLEKFSKPRYEDAGLCFTQAGCWSDAASCYFNAKCLSECLLACRKGQLIQLGWHFLQQWQGKLSNSEHINYLKSCILDSQKLTSISSLLGFCRNFPQDGYSLLLESGHFVEAATLHRMKGEALDEAYLLERAKNYGKSSKLVLFYVVQQMLWGGTHKGWPLKPFDQLKDLLAKAKSLSMMVSNSFHRYVCDEVDFLTGSRSNLLDNIAHLRMAQKYENVVVETFAARNILETYLDLEMFEFRQDSDATYTKQSKHLEKFFFNGHISIESLMFAWNLWKENLLGIISYLGSHGSIHTDKYDKYEVLCMKRFGVLKVHDHDFYVAVNGEAAWIFVKDEEDIYKVEEKVYMSGRVFRSLAEQFLKSEYCSVGIRLLEKLKHLIIHLSGRKLFSVQHAVHVLQFFGLANLLSRYDCDRSLLSTIVSGVDPFSIIFTLDLKKSIMWDRTWHNIQEKDSAVRALGDILHNNLESFSCGSGPKKIGWTLVFLFRSTRLLDVLAWEVRNKSRPISSWQKFFEQMVAYKHTGFEDVSTLASTFLDAVSYVDPESQLCLIESLIFFTSSFQIGRGWFLTSKSTLAKSLLYDAIDDYWYAFLQQSPRNDASDYLVCPYDFVLAIVSELLTTRSDVLSRRLRWAEKSKRNRFQFHQSLVLRLVVIVGLIGLNSKPHFAKAQRLLSKTAGILPVLPLSFLLELRAVKGDDMKKFKCFARAFSRAVQTARNQLVVVHYDGCKCAKSFGFLKPILLKRSLFQYRRKDAVVEVFGKEHVNLEYCEYLSI